MKYKMFFVLCFLFFAVCAFGQNGTPSALDVNMLSSEGIVLDSDGAYLSRVAQPTQYFDRVGTKAAIMGYEGSAFECWIWPWKVMRQFELSFFLGTSTAPLLARDIVKTIEVTPAATIFTYSYETFTVRQYIFVPADEPAVIMLLEVNSFEPLKIVPGFVPVMQPQWPAGIGGQYSYWDDALKGYVVSESQRRAIFLCGSPLGSQMTAPPAHMFADAPIQFAVSVPPDSSMLIPIIIAGGMNEKFEVVAERYKKYAADPVSYLKKTTEYYSNILSSTVSIQTPDEELNKAYLWGKIALHNLLVDNPTLGKGLVAGYGLSGGGGRPGFAWFFGGDTYVNSFALGGFGDLETVRDGLKMTQRYQRMENFPVRKKNQDDPPKDVGKMPHELSQSDGIVDWWNSYGYGYSHADTAPWYIVAVAEYVRRSGDTEFLKESWESLKAALAWTLTKDSDNDGLMDLKGAGLGVLEFGSLVKIHNDLYTQVLFTQSLKEMKTMAAVVGDTEIGESVSAKIPVALKRLEELFWMPEEGFYSFGANESGDRVKERYAFSVLPFVFKLLDEEKSVSSLKKILRSDMMVDWGIRSLSDSSAFFHPSNYNYGAVWPFSTMQVASALYHYRFPLQAFSLVKKTASLMFEYSLGTIPEVFSGRYHQKLAEAYHNQGFSVSGFMVPVLWNIAGIRVDALTNKVSISPILPADWNTLSVKNILVNKSTVSFDILREQKTYTFSVEKTGSEKVEVQFAPLFAPGIEINGVSVNGKEIPYTQDKGARGTICSFTVSLSGNETIVIKHTEVPEVFLIPEKSYPGEENSGLKIISYENTGSKLTILCEGVAGKEYRLGLRNPDAVKSISGAFQKENRILFQILRKTGTEKENFTQHEIVIELK